MCYETRLVKRLPVSRSVTLCRSPSLTAPSALLDQDTLLISLSLSVAPLYLKMAKGEQIVSPEECFQEGGPTVTFSHLHYYVQETKFCRKIGPEKCILKDVR